MITVEDHISETGLGGIVASVLVEHGITTRVETLGTKGYASSGSPQDLYKMNGLDADSIVRVAKKLCGS